MKKILVLLIGFVLFVMPMGWCEENSLSNLTNEQLNQLLIMIEQEIANRDGYLSNFYGTEVLYIVGDDIDPGVYVVSCVKKYNSALTGARMEGWNSEDEYNSSPDEPSIKPFIVLGESTKLTLKSGNVFKIQGGILTFDRVG